MKERPLVSVVMTTYLHEHTIIAAVEGVLAQVTDFNVELIIANDCSPDGTDEVVTRFLATYPVPTTFSIRYTQHAVNKGMIDNVIWGVQQVRGKYIAVCEGDDYWIDPFKLQTQADFLEANADYGLVHTNYKNYYAKTATFQVHQPSVGVSRSNENDYFLITGDIRTCTVLFRSSFLFSFKDLMEQSFMKDAVVGDRPFFLLISTLSKIHFINEVTSVYYVTAQTSASHFSDLFRYYGFLRKVSVINIALLDYLQIDKASYVKDQQRKISFYDVLLSFENKNYLDSLKLIFSKTGTHFWNKKELKEVYGLIRSK